MPLTDLPLDVLREYRGDVSEPADLDAFWAGSLALARGHDLAVELTDHDGPALPALSVHDVRFAGWNGDRIAAWLIRPAHLPGPLPVAVEFIGYSGGRGLPLDRTAWAAAGFALLVVDTRGQGTDTPDPDPDASGGQWARGFMTKGVEDPATYFYRRAYVDCARAVDVAHALPSLGVDVDTSRVVVRGGSQGGAFTIAAAALSPGRVAAALVDVPFLCHVRRGAQVAGDGPYLEVVDYLRRHSPEKVERTFATMAYVDGANLASRANVPTLFSAALMDPVCPPSTVFAAFNRWGHEDRQIDVWEFGDHGGGLGWQTQRQLRFLDRLGLR
ncbi:acetylxylan esterase [Kineococcus rhizosphaerae]|uniref:Cephalosporin-C deacetylase n=1 Tax=Kineococcus rhizosphaerae TaxID=559628 RepID=A0A2T0R7W4_9ACTN|nr:acetylxylan esterase [Kineococcus rhizosphaerae]PRY17256.1 cephalosporin-C deacetylase [Kineococcus rhizosphaerae]